MPRPARPNAKEARQRSYIREWRKDAGLTLEGLVGRLAELSGYEITDGQLSRIERGDQPYTQDLLEALAVALRCEPADLIRRPPGAPSGIQTEGLAPEQVRLVEGMVEQLRRTGN